jgi:hypothetical protein
MRALSQPPEIRIRDTTNRLLDTAARQSNVAELTIVHLPKHFHRRPPVQIRGECVRPSPQTAQKSAGIEENYRPGCGMGHRRHFSSPVASARQSDAAGVNAGDQRRRLDVLIACTLLSAISGLMGSK